MTDPDRAEPGAARKEAPAHHDPGGGFRNPWFPDRARRIGAVLKWMWERRKEGVPPDPDPAALPRGEAAIARPRTGLGETRVTWVGHASHLVQHGGANVLTDPHWSVRAAPVQWLGPSRFVPPGIAFDALPPIDAVVLSHDHYDHLDEDTVRRLVDRFGDAITWFSPLGYEGWLRKRGARAVVELDWWEEARLSTPAGETTITALPAQHWTRRGIASQERLWASWALRSASGSAVYFGGDSGYCPVFREIGRRIGPFDVSLLPIGAYEPRWFMKRDHMNPEEAVQAYLDLGGEGTFVGMHWGTFRLTDEDPLEPPVRTRAAWRAAGLPEEALWLPRHGETRVVEYSREAAPERLEPEG